MFYLVYNLWLCVSDNDGRGAPVFHHEQDCVYWFEWETKYACIDHPLDEECRVNNKYGQKFDLSNLIKTHGKSNIYTTDNCNSTWVLFY